MAGVVSAGGSSSKGRRPLDAPRGTSSSGSPRSCSFPVGGGLPSRAFMRPSLLALFLLTALALASAEQGKRPGGQDLPLLSCLACALLKLFVPWLNSFPISLKSDNHRR